MPTPHDIRDLKKIYDSITDPNHLDKLTYNTPPKISVIFSKTYGAPGYPIDPVKERVRRRQGIINRTLDARREKELAKQTN